MLKNAYLFAKIGADKAENEQHVAEILPIGRRVADRVELQRPKFAKFCGGHPNTIAKCAQLEPCVCSCKEQPQFG